MLHGDLNFLQIFLSAWIKFTPEHFFRPKKKKDTRFRQIILRLPPRWRELRFEGRREESRGLKKVAEVRKLDGNGYAPNSAV